jgi:hypothetical protein
MTSKNYFQIFVLLIMLLTISSCAPYGRTSDEYGLISGIWHGFCFPFAIVGKIFGADIGLYAQHNSGFFYWIGFLFGIGGLGGGASRR